jgi:hypothetical protein
MQIQKRNGHDDNFASTIRAGLVTLGRKNATEGMTIFVPPPEWTPQDGAAGLVAVKVKQIDADVALGEDATGQPWALWLK